MPTTRLIAALLTALLLAPAGAEAQDAPALRATSMVSTEAPGFRIRPGATLMWDPQAVQIIEDQRFGSTPLQTLFTQQIATGLQEKGFRLTEVPAEATFRLGLLVALSTDLPDSEVLRKFGATPGLAGAPSDQLEKGTVALLLVDPDRGEPVWKTVFQGFADFEASPEQRGARVKRVIDRMLQTLPDVPG